MYLREVEDSCSQEKTVGELTRQNAQTDYAEKHDLPLSVGSVVDKVDEVKAIGIYIGKYFVVMQKISEMKMMSFAMTLFIVLKKLEFGKGYQVPEITKNASFNSIGYPLKSNSSVEIGVDCGWLYGDLEVGNYRILKRLGYKSDYDKEHYL